MVWVVEVDCVVELWLCCDSGVVLVDGLVLTLPCAPVVELDG